MESKYNSHCLTLLSTIQREIKRCYRNIDNFTVLMHVPLKKLGTAIRRRTNFGYLVDVSDSDGPVDGLFAAQCPLSGESGKLFNNPAFDDLRKVHVSHITPEVQVQYRKANKDMSDASNLLVERESRRYSLGEATGADVPPQGKYIYQVALSPDRRRCEYVPTNPVLGVVYKISDSEHLPSAERDQLVKISIDAGGIVFIKLIQMFYGKKYKSLFSEFFHPSHTGYDLGVIHSVIATFLLSHHWFYAFAPTALKALLLLCEDDRKAVEKIYTRSNFQFPNCSIDRYRCPDEMTQIIESLSNDMLALLLCGYWDDGINESEIYERRKAFIKREIWRVLVALTGKPFALNDEFSPVGTFPQGSYFTIGLTGGLARLVDEDCLVPYFTEEQFKSMAESVKKEMLTFYRTFAPSEFAADSFYSQREKGDSDWTFIGPKKSPAGSLSLNANASNKGKYRAHTHGGSELKKYWKSMRWIKICVVYNILSAMPAEIIKPST